MPAMPTRLTLFFLTSLLAVGGAQGQAIARVSVQRNVNLRQDPSTTQDPIRLLIPFDTLTLLDSTRTAGYLHVTTKDDETGWVWANNVRRIADDSTVVIAGLAANAIASSIDSTWEKPAPNTTSFTSPSTGVTCDSDGEAGDSATNVLKNRTNVPSAYHPVSFRAIADLPFPRTPEHRHDWTGPQRDSVVPYEGVAVTVVGYAVALRVQTSGSGESTNCHMHKSAEVDWHIALVESPGDGEEKAMVVETTPRVRRTHPQWTKARFTPWVDSANPVRVSGWLMFDPEHRNQLGRYRSTLWEVHPITKLEVWDGTAWVPLDDIP
jgi:hypothetical protein